MSAALVHVHMLQLRRLVGDGVDGEEPRGSGRSAVAAAVVYELEHGRAVLGWVKYLSQAREEEMVSFSD